MKIEEGDLGVPGDMFTEKFNWYKNNLASKKL